MEHVNVLPITTDELDRPDKRPRYSVLRNFMLELTIGDTMRPWEDALKEYIIKLEEYKLF
jgi:dTDP-4-dehydrorhamnose reductase